MSHEISSTTARGRALFLCAKLDNGGAERHWAKLIPALRDAGVGVRLVAIEGSGRALELLREDGIPIRELGRTGIGSLRALPALMHERAGSPTVVVTFGYNAHVLGATFARLAARPHVVNWHRQAGWPMNRVERGALRVAAAAGAGAIAVSHSQLNDLHALGFPGSRIRVVANGVAGPTPLPRDNGLRSSLGIGADAVLAVLVARLRPEKRVRDFIDAISAAATLEPSIRGVVVGDGPMSDELRAYAKGRRAPVDLVGHSPEPMEWMLTSDFVVLSSAYEALPISLVEAVACGRPIVATDVGGTREIVEDGVNGVVVPPGDVEQMAMGFVMCARDPERRRAMGHAARAKWERSFSFDAMTTAYVRLLSSVDGPPAAWRR